MGGLQLWSCERRSATLTIVIKTATRLAFTECFHVYAAQATGKRVWATPWLHLIFTSIVFPDLERTRAWTPTTKLKMPRRCLSRLSAEAWPPGALLARLHESFHLDAVPVRFWAAPAGDVYFATTLKSECFAQARP